MYKKDGGTMPLKRPLCGRVWGETMKTLSCWMMRHAYDGELILAVEQDVLTAAFYGVDELERQATAANDRNVGQVAEPVAVCLEMSFMNARQRQTHGIAIIRTNLTTTTTTRNKYNIIYNIIYSVK